LIFDATGAVVVVVELDALVPDIAWPCAASKEAFASVVSFTLCAWPCDGKLTCIVNSVMLFVESPLHVVCVNSHV
jgi:hypothetical protein